MFTYGKVRERITIGRYPTISLADAWTEAKQFLAERTLRPDRLKVSDAMERFLGEQRQKNRLIPVKCMEALTRNRFPKILGKNLKDVNTGAIKISGDW